MTSKYVYIPSPEYIALMETAQRYKSKLRELTSHKNDEFTVTSVGLYNQGKSQLLNALVSDCNNSTFSVSDCRETVVTKKVKCGDIVYVDTPGLNASGEDDRTTIEEFSYPDLFLFVHKVGQGELVKQEIEYLIKASRYWSCDSVFLQHSIFVLSASENVNESEKSATENRIRSQLFDIFKSSELKIFCVSAKVYQKGISEGKNLLVKMSNIDELRTSIKKNKELLYSESIRKRVKQINDLRESALDTLYKARSLLLKEKMAFIQYQQNYHNDLNKFQCMKDG